MGVATAPTAAGMSSSTAAMRMSLRIRTMARASFFIHFLPKSIFSPFQRKTTFLVFPIYFIIVLSLWVSRDNPSRQLSQGESLGKQKAGRTGGQVCVSRILFLFCTGRRTRAPALRAGKAEQTISRFPFYK